MQCVLYCISKAYKATEWKLLLSQPHFAIFTWYVCTCAKHAYVILGLPVRCSLALIRGSVLPSIWGTISMGCIFMNVKFSRKHLLGLPSKATCGKNWKTKGTAGSLLLLASSPPTSAQTFTLSFPAQVWWDFWQGWPRKARLSCLWLLSSCKLRLCMEPFLNTFLRYLSVTGDTLQNWKDAIVDSKNVRKHVIAILGKFKPPTDRSVVALQ